MSNQQTRLNVRNLNVWFTVRGREFHAIRNLSLEVFAGENLAIVGESGAGKSVFAKSLMGLLDVNSARISGEILYQGENLASYQTEKQWKAICGREIAMVMQDPMTALNPLICIGDQIAEAVTLHQNKHGAQAREAVLKILSDVGISEPQQRYRQYPHEFSGGMRQRVVIAIAIACRPKILICDEPTTALDVTTQARILSLLQTLQRKYNLSIVYITHDFGVVARIAHRVAVLYAGEIVELGTCEEIFYDPRHPYTWALLSSLPQYGVRDEALYSIGGRPPNLFYEVVGDAFAPRSNHALKIDFIEHPHCFAVSPTHWARTWLLDPRAPKIEPPMLLRRKPKEDVSNG